MTAHAMKGDRERCIDAGMDGYVSKPVRSQQLFDAIDRLVAPSDPPSARGTDNNFTDRVLDRPSLLLQFGGDLELLQKLVPFFLQDAAELLSSISDSIAKGNSRALEHAAHKLKGCVANFHASAVVGAAQRLEDIGHACDFSGARHALALLEDEMRRLEPALIELAGESAKAISKLGL